MYKEGESTVEEVKLQIHIPSVPAHNTKSTGDKARTTQQIRTITTSTSSKERHGRPDFDGGCWEMLNQDAVQILPPKPPIPTKPTTSCIKPTFKDKEKKGLLCFGYVINDER